MTAFINILIRAHQWFQGAMYKRKENLRVTLHRDRTREFCRVRELFCILIMVNPLGWLKQPKNWK